MFSLKGKRVYVAGHTGMVGRALRRRLATEDCINLHTERAQVDLLQQASVQAWFKQAKPEVVFVAAAKVGGIEANRRFPATFLYENLLIASNIIQAAYENAVEKLLFLGSSCIYPRDCVQPISEEALLTGPLESSNEGYAIAKIAGLKLIQTYRQQYGCDFISCMPTNLYGPYDHYDLQNSHVLPALLHKIHSAKKEHQKTVTLWGTGTPKREFLYVDDLADACIYLMKHYSDALSINVGVGEDLSIRALAEKIAQLVDYQGTFVFDTSMPDGTPRKCLDIHRLRTLGWEAQTDLWTGLHLTYDDYQRRIS